MSTAKNTTNQEVKNNSIINVTVNGMTANDTITNVKSRLESVEKSAFNIALLCAYGTGVTIPEYTDNNPNGAYRFPSGFLFCPEAPVR